MSNVITKAIGKLWSKLFHERKNYYVGDQKVSRYFHDRAKAFIGKTQFPGIALPHQLTQRAKRDVFDVLFKEAAIDASGREQIIYTLRGRQCGRSFKISEHVFLELFEKRKGTHDDG